MRKFWLGAAVVLIIATSTLFFTRESWLAALGRTLVRTDEPAAADVVIVLGGDWQGNRILKAGELVRQGLAPVALVSGSGYLYGNYEADLAIQFASHHGFEPRYFRKLEYPAISTKDEAQAVIREMRRMGVKRYLLVTSKYHTARAARIFEEAAPELGIRVLASEDTIGWDHWWTEREARKTFFYEYIKSVTSLVGI